MLPIPGWTTVGPVPDAPGGPMVWARDGSQASYVVIGFRDDLQDHPMLHQGMTAVARFLRAPGVKGVAPLAEWVEPKCLFAYPARDGVPLAAVLKRLRDQGRSAGPHPALELLVTVAPLLDDAARAGRRHGLPGHGALNPWRLLIHPLGGVTLLGYGVPAVEVNAWLDEETTLEPGPSLDYFPPERIQEEDEDLRGDLYSLALAALELLLGRSVFEGDAEARVEQISEGRPARVAANLETRDLQTLFAKALDPAPARRFSTGKALAEAAATLLKPHPGVSVFDLAAAAAMPDEGLDEETSVSYVVRGAHVPDEPTDDGPITEVGLADDLRPVALSFPPPPPARHEEDATLVTLQRALGQPITRSAPPQYDFPEVDRTDVIGIPAELIEALTAVDAHAPPPPIPDPGPDPSLAAIQSIAGRIVDRTSDLAARALSLAARVQERATPEPAQQALGRAARTAADRGRRSADAARNAANLLALDEDASGALITLDLVRNAELQCESALTEVQGQHKELERFAERVQAQARALQDAARRATEHANRATDAANQADDLVTVLEQEQQEGLLAAPGTIDAVDLATASAERAHASAEQARSQADQSTRSDRADLAMRYAENARRAEDAALDALRETREAADRARRTESAAREALSRAASESAARARTAAEDAWRALQRAEEAVRLAGNLDARRARDECAGLVRDAEAAATEADRALQGARDTERTSDLLRVASVADAAAEKAERAAIEASATSDRIVRAAGAVAETRARLSKLQEEGRAIAERTRSSLNRTRDESDALLDAMSRLPTDVLTTQRKDLVAELAAAGDGIGAIDARMADVLSGPDAAAVEASLGALKRVADALQGRIANVERLLGALRDQADDELRDQERREEARRDVARSATQARDAARRCREQVDQAMALSGSIPAALPGCRELDEVVRLRARAMEIVDIAEFQAGEAQASADAAARERDPSEARGHAQTASSFLDRISADVPEALSSLQEGARLARHENDAIQAARARAAECEAVVQQLQRESSAAVAAALRDAADWRGHSALAPAIDAANAVLTTFDEDLNETTWARDHVGKATSSAECQEYLPRAEAAVARARERRRRADAGSDGIRKGIAAAEAAAATLTDARRSTRAALESCTADAAKIGAAQQRLKEALIRHGGGRANDLETANAELGLRELAQKVRELRQELQGLADKAEVATDAEVARSLATRAAEHRVTSERALERAAETEVRGVAAAEQQAKARAEAEQRRLQSGREAAANHARRARQAVERLDHALDEAEEEGAQTPSPDARARFDEAERLGEALRTTITEIERLAEEARSMDGADAVQAIAERGARLLQGIDSDAGRVLVVVQEALDLSRAAAAEASALRSVQDEVRSMVAAADEAVERAQREATRIRHLLGQSPRPEFRTMQEQAASALQSATSGAAKVRAAVPLAEQASSLPIAEATLRAARQALDRAVGASEVVRQLGSRGAELLQKEKDTLAAAVAEARTRAAAPAQEASAAAAKAVSWAEAGRKEWEEAGRNPSLDSLVRVLERSAADVRQKATAAQDAAKRTSDAPTEETARSLGRDVRHAADVTIESANHARAALDELRAQIQQLRSEATAVHGLVQEAAEHAAAAAQVADQAEATLRELEVAVDSLAMPSENVDNSLLTVRTCATNARFAAATAASLADAVRAARRRADAEQAVEDAHRALEDALDALERVVAAEATCRAAIEAHQLRRRQASERAEQERRQRELDEARAQADADRRAREAEEDDRRRRDEERRVRMDRRREERDVRLQTGPVPAPEPRRVPSAPPPRASMIPSRPPPPPSPPPSSTPAPAADRESLRSMLRQNRPGLSGGTAESTARPRRRSEVRRDLPDLGGPDPDGATEHAPESSRRVPEYEPTEDRADNTSARNVRTWSPGARQPVRSDATAARARPRPDSSISRSRPAGLRAPVEDLTEPGGASTGDKVDALLERLRARRSSSQD